MSLIHDARGELLLGGIPLAAVAAQFGTPTYVYDLDAIAAEARALREAFGDARHLVAYAVKANSAGAVVRTLAAEGCGADVVSVAELLVALGCGIPPSRILYSGVAKQDDEIDRALASGDRGICAVQMESLEEVQRVEARARAAGRKARVSLRVNPAIDLVGETHAHITTGHDAAKFGVHRGDVAAAIRRIEASPHLELVGMATHVGSQFRSARPYVDGARVLFDIVRGLRDAGGVRALAFVDTGGGFGVDYAGDRDASGPRPADFVRAVREEQRALRLDDLALYVEPGRSLVAAHGVLLARVIQPKVTPLARWLMIDAGMNDLMRPALYQAKHRIVPLRRGASGREADPSAHRGASTATASELAWRVVGPVCESSDDFGEHLLPAEPPQEVAILDAGAYGYTMANRYNGRQLPVEVFTRGGRVVASTARVVVDRWVEERLEAGR